MIVFLITNCLTIIVVWIIARKVFTAKSSYKNMAIIKQVNYMYIKNENNHKRKKGKKGTRRVKKESA